MRRLTFRRCGYVGVAGATALALALTWRLGLSLLLESSLIVIACLTFLALAVLTRRVAGRERLVYYHHEVAVLAVVALATWIAGGSVLAYLDVTALGLGVFLACGRVGCLTAGCCHGRPARRGVVYGPEHAELGFTRHLVGIPLVPVQAIEAALALAIVTVGTALVLNGQPAGTGLTLYVGAYAVARFTLEFLRGDPLRPYWRGVSEAQWTSVVLGLLVVVGGWAHALPAHWWHAIAAAVLLVGLAGALATGRRGLALLHPRHVQEVARILNVPSAGGDTPTVHTSAGLALSCAQAGDRLDVVISADGRALSRTEVSLLAWLIGSMRPRYEVELVGGPAHIWHVLLSA